MGNRPVNDELYYLCKYHINKYINNKVYINNTYNDLCINKKCYIDKTLTLIKTLAVTILIILFLSVRRLGSLGRPLQSVSPAQAAWDTKFFKWTALFECSVYPLLNHKYS